MKQYEFSVHLFLELWHFLTVPVSKHKENKIWIYVLTLTMIRIDPQFFTTLLLVQLNDKILKSLNIFILLKIRKFCLKQPISLWQPPKREIEILDFFLGGGAHINKDIHSLVYPWIIFTIPTTCGLCNFYFLLLYIRW